MKNFFLVIALIFIPNICLANQLIKAIENNSINQTYTLLKSGTNPNQSGDHGITPLMKASILNNIKITKLLLKYKADPNKTNIAKASALHLAARKGHHQIISLLIEANANVNARDFSGYTPLMRAVSTNKYSSTEILLKNHAKTLIKNNNGENTFDIAIENNHTELIPLLLKNLHHQNLQYLKSLHTHTINLKRKKISDAIEARIAILKAKKTASEQKITITHNQVKKQIITTPLQNFPCMNNEINHIDIKINTCINSKTKILLTQTPIAKPIKFTIIENQLDTAYIKNHLHTEKTFSLSWKTESIIPIRKSINILPLSTNAITPTSISTLVPQPKFLTPSITSSPLNKPNHVISQQPVNITAVSLKNKNKILLTQTPIAKPIKFIIIENQLDTAYIKNHLHTEKTFSLSWKTESIIPIRKSINISPLSTNAITPTSISTLVPQPKFLTPSITSSPLNKPNHVISQQPVNITAVSLKNKKTEPIIPIKRTIPNLNHKDISNYVRVANIRTNEWSINPRTIPVSTIDFETLGPDLLFNRKYIIPYDKEIEQPTKPAPKAKVIAKPNPTQKTGYFIQIGTYANFENAKNTAHKAKEYGNTFFSKATLNNKKVLKVLVGPFKSEKSAKSTKSKKEFKKLFGSKTIIRKF